MIHWAKMSSYLSYYQDTRKFRIRKKFNGILKPQFVDANFCKTKFTFEPKTILFAFCCHNRNFSFSNLKKRKKFIAIAGS